MALQTCTKCLLSNQDEPSLRFDAEGVCHMCRHYEVTLPQRAKSASDLEQVVAVMKKDGQGKPYDCIVGVSGGTDSTYVAYLAKSLGLRPLAVHLDNGWNSELAIMNIQRILDTLGFDLYTYVINWEEFKDLQRAYIKASVIDIEALTDHAIIATLFKVSKKFGVPYILSGEHFATEGVLPASWIHNKLDHVNIRAIHQRFGELPVPSFPMMNYYQYRIENKLKPLRYIPILNYVPYEKKEVVAILVKELGWRDYGGKHHESVFTRFYQSYILPVKFGVDKRKSHYSTLIRSGQWTRQEGLAALEKPICDPDLLAEDKVYVVKKLGFSMEEFDFFMAQPPVPHTHYPSVLHQLRKAKKWLTLGLKG
jgi:N-acetyl sugar amidotransferase